MLRNGDKAPAKQFSFGAVVNDIELYHEAPLAAPGTLDPGGFAVEVQGASGGEAFGEIGEDHYFEVATQTPRSHNPPDIDVSFLGMGRALEIGAAGVSQECCETNQKSPGPRA